MSKIEEQMPGQTGSGDSPASRKTYQRPHLVEWGSLVDLTRGGFSGLDDLPFDGGTTPE